MITAIRARGNQRRCIDSTACRIEVAKLAEIVGLTAREIVDVFAVLPPSPDTEDWGRVADALIREAEAHTAPLRSRLSEMRSGARLCEIVKQTSRSTPPSRRPCAVVL